MRRYASRLVPRRMCAADGQCQLPGVLGWPCDRGQQQWPCGDRLAMMVRISETHEQAPPIIDQRHRAREQTASRQILCGEAAPTPLVLQLVKRVLAVGTIAIQLPERQDFRVQRG